MPRLMVVTGASEHRTAGVLLSERVSVVDFESPHFRAQLIERLTWAVGDADAAERALSDDGEAAGDPAAVTASPFLAER